MVRDSDGGGIVMVGDCSLGLEIVVGRKEEGGGGGKYGIFAFFPYSQLEKRSLTTYRHLSTSMYHSTLPTYRYKTPATTAESTCSLYVSVSSATPPPLGRCYPKANRKKGPKSSRLAIPHTKSSNRTAPPFPFYRISSFSFPLSPPRCY